MRPYCCGTAPEAKRRPSALRHHDRLEAEGRGLAGFTGLCDVPQCSNSPRNKAAWRHYCCETAPGAKRRPSARRHHDRLKAEGRGLAGLRGSRGSATFLSARTVLAIKPRGGIIAAELRLRNIVEPCTLLCQEWLEVRGW